MSNKENLSIVGQKSNNDVLAELAHHLKQDPEVRKLQEDVKIKKIEVDYHKYSKELETINNYKAELATAEKINIDNLDDKYNHSSLREHEEYLNLAKHRLRFLLPDFDHVVPLFPKNLLLFGSVTGGGKSSTAAQLVHSCLSQTYSLTDKGCRVLYISNEETRGEIYTRVAFLFKDWKYSRLDKLTDEQKNFSLEFQKTIFDSKRLMVIDNDFSEIRKPTTSIEGLSHILHSVERNKNDFNVIIVDYFNKLGNSTEYPSRSPQEVLSKVCDLLDDFRRRLNCPIVVFTQLWPKTSEKTTFEDRLKDRKLILQPATFAAEIEIDRPESCTHFHVVKNRLVSNYVGRTVTVGYDPNSGKLVRDNLSDREEWKRKYIDEQTGYDATKSDELIFPRKSGHENQLANAIFSYSSGLM